MTHVPAPHDAALVARILASLPEPHRVDLSELDEVKRALTVESWERLSAKDKSEALLIRWKRKTSKRSLHLTRSGSSGGMRCTRHAPLSDPKRTGTALTPS